MSADTLRSARPHPSGASRLSGLTALLSCLVLAVTCLIPYDFMAKTSFFQLLLRITWLVCALILFRAYRDPSLRIPLPYTVLGVTLVTLTALTGGSVRDQLVILLFFAAGLISSQQRIARLLAGILVSLCLGTVLLELAMQENWYYNFFPGSKTQSSSFRAVAFFGEPLVAALVLTVSGLWLLYYRGLSVRARLTLFATLIIAAAVTTGSKSVLVVALTTPVIVQLASSRNLITGAIGAMLTLAVVASILTVGVHVPGGDKLRALEFTSVSDTQSYSVRQTGLELVDSLERTCSLTCKIAGHGHGALKNYLATFGGVNPSDTPRAYAFTTVDDLYLTTLYDNGAIGLLALVACGIASVRAVRSDSILRRASGAGLIAALLYSTLFDSIYLLSGAIIVGWLVGASCEANRECRSAK